MIAERSPVSNSARSVFFEDINDVDIYVEDTAPGYSKIYSILFSRAFSGEYKVEKVFPIGRRVDVLKLHNDHTDSGRPSVYVVDGDLHVLTGDAISNTAGLFILPFYCIENLLCNERALIETLHEEDPVRDAEAITEIFNYESWASENCIKLYNLFVEYALSFKLNTEAQTVAYPVRKIVLSEKGDICSHKLENRINEVRSATIAIVGEHEYNKEKDALLATKPFCGIDSLRHVSGKDYVFPLLKMRAKSVVKTNMPDINLKIRLSMKCDVTELIDSKNYIFC